MRETFFGWSGNLRKQAPEVFCRTAILRSFVKFTGKHLHWSLFINKGASGTCKFILKILQRKCFPVKFATFLRTPFLQISPDE